MSLITKEVTMTINGRNKKYYKELGYDIPNQIPRNQYKILVKVEDLPLNSEKQVETVCDNCGVHRFMKYQDYARKNHNGKTYCNKCAHSVLCSGENNNRWNPDLTDEERNIRRSYPEYLDFCRKVKYRDNFTCQCCGSQRELEVHHLNGYSWDIENRLEVSNAVSLCKTCHQNFHYKYGKEHNTKEQYDEWIGYTKEYYDYNNELPPVKQVICLETKEIYKSAKDAGEMLNILPSMIMKCCLRQESRKRYNNSTKSVHGLHFLYLDDYNNMSNDDWTEYYNWIYETKSFISDNHRHSSCRKIVCLETKELFNAMKDAANKYHLSSGALSDCCKGKLNTTGGYHWMYYEDYIQNYDINELRNV